MARTRGRRFDRGTAHLSTHAGQAERPLENERSVLYHQCICERYPAADVWRSCVLTPVKLPEESYSLPLLQFKAVRSRVILQFMKVPFAIRGFDLQLLREYH